MPVRSAHGFSLVELLIVVAIIGILAAIGLGVSGSMVRTAKGQAGAQQLASFMKRHRELAISRRRNIQIVFTAPNRVQSLQMAVPNPPAATPAPTVLETMFLENRLQYQRFAGVADTPDAFGNAADVSVGAILPAMFTSEGAFTDGNGDVVNGSIFLGVPNQATTANAITVVGATAAVRLWRWDGSKWVQ